jgi:hypothetical protein
MATYQNTIEITDLSWNDVSGNVNTVSNVTFNQVNQDQIIYWNNGQGNITYKTAKDLENTILFYNLSGTDISGYNGFFYSDTSKTIIIGQSNFGAATRIDTGVNRQYKGFTYNLWDDLSNNIVSDEYISGFILYPDDDNGGPSINVNPGFIPMNEPVFVKSSLSSEIAGNARVKVVGTITPTTTSWTEEVIDITGTSAGFYPTNLFSTPTPGLWVGLDLEPTAGGEDYIYIFFANSNCFHSQTILETENGPMCIKDIERGMLVKTRNGFKKVVRVLSNGCKLKDFVVFEKGSLGPNVPNKKLMITKGHPVYYRGKYLNSLEFVKNNFFDRIYIKRLETEGLHHIQFETHECVLTNNLWTTSLPHNMGNKVPEDLYFDKSLFNPNDKGKHYPPYCLHKDPPTDQLDDDDLEEIFNYN